MLPWDRNRAWFQHATVEGVVVKRTSHQDETCAVARPLDVIGDGWSLLIIRDAFDGLRRFGQFQKSLGLAKNILSAERIWF